MKSKKMKKAISTTAAAALVLSTAANVLSVPEAAAAGQGGASYFQTEDNIDPEGKKGLDGDLDVELKNDNDKYPIEFNIDAQKLPEDAKSAALVIRGHDVDEEQGEWDRVYLNGGKQPIGALSGNDGAWNSTVFYLDPNVIKEGANYVEILINNTNPRYSPNQWALTVDWGQIVVNDGPKDKIEIDRQTPPTVTGTGKTQTVTYTALPHATGNYIAEINLLDKDGNNVATIQQDIKADNTNPKNMTATFNRIDTGEYTANVVFFEIDENNETKGGPHPGQIQDMWTTNKPPVVRTLKSLTPAAINEAFIDLDSPEDPLVEVTFSNIPAGKFYVAGEPVKVNNGTVVLSYEQIQSGLKFVPEDSGTKDVTFNWNGSDGKMYGLAPAEVILVNSISGSEVLKPIEKSVKQNQELSFTDHLNFTDYYIGEKPVETITAIKITSIPEKSHGLKDGEGDLVVAGQTFTPEQFKKLVFDANEFGEGKAIYQWSVSDETGESAQAPMTFTVTDGISPAIKTAIVNDNDPYPKTITLTYGEGVQVKDADGFTVEINDLPVDIASAELNGENQVTLTLTEPIKPGATLTLSYDAAKGNVTDIAGNPAVSLDGETAFEIINQVREPLNGWVGDRTIDGTEEVIVKPGDLLKLSAISELAAEKVMAVLFSGTTNEVSVPLTLTTTEKGHKVWGYSEFKLPEAIATGDYQVEFIAYDAKEKEIQTETEARKVNNEFYLAADIDLTGTVTDQRNEKPLANAVVTLFDAKTLKAIINPATEKPFRTETDENGKYKFTDVPTGRVHVNVQKTGYYSVEKQVVNTMPKTKTETLITSNVTLKKSFSGSEVLKPIAESVKQNQEFLFEGNLEFKEYYVGNETIKTFIITSIPEKSHGLKDGEGNLVKAGQDFELEDFEKMTFDGTDFDEGEAVYYWSVSNGTEQSAQVPMTFTVTDGVSPAIETATVNNSDPYPNTVTLTYDEDIQAEKADGFTVNIDGKLVEIKSAVLDGKNKITLTLAEAIKPGEALTIGYNADEGNVMDKAGNSAVSLDGKSAIKIINQVREPLNGWVGDRTIDGTEEVIVKPGSSLKLSAISELAADKVTASLLGGSEEEIALTLTSTEKGYKVWDNSEFKLPETLLKTGDYEVVFTAYDTNGKAVQPAETEARKVNNSFYLAAEVGLTGTVTDQRNEKPLAKAVVTLFDADTKEPIIDPSTEKPFRAETDENGKYEFEDVPTGTVYLTVQKSGYRTVTKQAVDTMPKTKAETIITSNVVLSKASSGGGIPVYIPDAALDLSVSSERVLAGTTSKVTVKYENNSTAPLNTGIISIEIPNGAKVIDPDGGKVEGQKIIWTVNDISAGKGGQFNIDVKWPEIDSAETTLQLVGTLTATNPNTEARTFTSSAVVQLYTAQEELLEHTRYIMGYKDGEFKPGESVTRGQLAAILARLVGNPEVKGKLTYRDVAEGQWATDYIKVVTKYGYFSGYSDGTFRQGKALTRGELASVMVRFLDLKVEQKLDHHFTDTKGHWAAAAIETLYSKDYLSGYKNGTFRPDSAINRAEAVTMINRMLERGPLTDHAPIYSDVDERFWAFGDIQEATISHESTRNEDNSESFKEKIEDTVK